MKGSFAQNEQVGSFLNKVGRRRFNVTKRKSQALGTCVHWMENKLAEDVKIRPPVQKNAATIFADTAHVLSRSGYFDKPRRTAGLFLPPIGGSRSTADHTLETVKPQTSPRNVVTGKSTFGSFGSQGRRILQSQPCNKIYVALGGGNKAAIQLASQPHQPLPSVPANAAIWPKKDISGPGSNHRGGEHDASLSDPKQQRNLCFGDSAAETESESSSNKDGPQTPKEGSDDEYYNDQRIGEWILKVNSSLFSKGNKEITEPTQAQEHDVVTIKIMYNGE